LQSAVDEILRHQDSELIPCAKYFENEPGQRSAAKCSRKIGRLLALEDAVE
jgi:hypothetical protein